MTSLLNKTRTLSIAIVALVVVLPACAHRKVVHVGTHTVTVSRHGFEKKFSVSYDDKASNPTLEYASVARDGKGLKVSLRGDDIRVNGVAGKLKPGDSVLITDDGVAVNNLDYGESARYLKANYIGADAASLN